jgi:restriction system protein
MPNVTKRRTGEFVRELTRLLSDSPDGIQAKTAIARLAESFTLTEYEAGKYPSGPGQRFNYIVRFATVDLVKAGWLRKEKGRWYVTEEGRAAYAKHKDPEAFYSEATRLYRVWKRAQPDEVEELDASAELEAQSSLETTRTFEEAEELAWDEIWAFLAKVPPYEFQDMVRHLLEAMGYYVSWVAPPGRDGGIDVIAWTDPLGTKPPRIKVQVKRRTDAIPVHEVRSFMAVLGEDDVGLFVTSGTFTKDAADETRTQSNRMLTLIDNERFADLWIEHYEKLPEKARRMLPVRPIYFLAPSE